VKKTYCGTHAHFDVFHPHWRVVSHLLVVAVHSHSHCDWWSLAEAIQRRKNWEWQDYHPVAGLTKVKILFHYPDRVFFLEEDVNSHPILLLL